MGAAGNRAKKPQVFQPEFVFVFAFSHFLSKKRFISKMCFLTLFVKEGNFRWNFPCAVGALCVLGIGCWGRGIEYKSDGALDTGAPETVACGEQPEEITGWSIRGVAVDLETLQPASLADGLCATAIDPSPVLAGSDPTDLAVGQVCDDGAFAIYNLGDAPAVGMFVVIDDCEPSADDTADTVQDLVLQSANGVKSDDVAGLEAGDEYVMNSEEGKGDLTYLTRTYQAVLEAELVAYTGSLDADGFLGGRLLDASLQSVAGATIDCSTCGELTPSYQDADASDGRFETAGEPNAASLVEADSRFFLPGAGVSTYEVQDGGAHSWEPTLLGSLPGYAVFSNFIALD